MPLSEKWESIYKPYLLPRLLWVSNVIRTGKCQVNSSFQYNSHGHKTNTQVQSHQKDSSYAHWWFYSRDVKGGRSIRNNPSGSPFFILFFFQSGKPLLFFPVPKSDFKATNLEGIQAKLLLFNVGEMEEWESYLLCLPVTSESLLWVPWIHANNLITE